MDLYQNACFFFKIFFDPIGLISGVIVAVVTMVILRKVLLKNVEVEGK